MPIRIPSVVEVNRPLNLPVEIDPDQTAFVKVRPATNREVELRAALELSTERSIVSNDTGRSIRVKQGYTYADQRRLEVYLTLAGDSGIVVEDPMDADKVLPLFRYRKIEGKMRLDMTEDEFMLAWGVLSSDWADAIHRAVLEVNPQWDPNK